MSEIVVEAEPLPPREVIEYLEIPLRRPLLCMIPFVLLSIGAILAYLSVPRLYRSSTLILVESERVPDALLSGKIELPRTTERLRVIKQQILSRTRLERIVQELEPYPSMTGKRTPSEIVEMMRDTIDIRVKGDDAFIVEYTNRNPYLAMAVTNRLATLFIEEAGQARKQEMAAAHQFIESQLEETLHELESKEKQLRLIRQKHMGALPEELTSNISMLTRLQMEKQTMEETIRAGEDRAVVMEKNLAELMQRGGDMELTSTGQPTGRSELSVLRSELAQLRSRYTDQHPEVQRLHRRIEKLESAQAEEAAAAPAAPNPATKKRVIVNPAVDAAKNQLEAMRLEITRLKGKSEDLDQRIVALDKAMAETPNVEEEMATLNRDYSKLKDHYDTLVKKRMDAEMAEKLESTWKGDRFRMLDPAYLPDRPFSPQIAKFLAGGVGVGLLIGLGAAVAAELLDHSVKNARELEVVLPHPLLVTIPHIVPRRRRLVRSTAPQLEAGHA